MDNILSYCGLVDARISTSEKDLPVNQTEKSFGNHNIDIVREIKVITRKGYFNFESLE